MAYPFAGVVESDELNPSQRSQSATDTAESCMASSSTGTLGLHTLAVANLWVGCGVRLEQPQEALLPLRLRCKQRVLRKRPWDITQNDLLKSSTTCTAQHSTAQHSTPHMTKARGHVQLLSSSTRDPA
jgi:hypothetical protein